MKGLHWTPIRLGPFPIGLGLILCLSLARVPAAEADLSPRLAEAQEFLDQGNPDAAISALEKEVARRKPDPRALLLNSTALLMLGEQQRGEADLDRALRLDPSLRQGWLNRAALRIAEKSYKEAQTALEEAQKLDPSAEDNHLNLGAVKLLQGQLAPATQEFEAYLARRSNSSEAAYLVAANYALAGYVQLAVKNLRQAILLDERARLQARTDGRFEEITGSSAYQRLLQEDSYRLPAGAYTLSRMVPLPYGADGGELLGAVIDSLRAARLPFDPRVEVTPSWSLLWGELRIKVSPEPGGDPKQGIVEISAPAERLSPTQWQQRTDSLLRELYQRADRPRL